MASSRRGRAPAVILVAASLFASLGYAYRLSRYPRYVDFDSATLGIFVNNLSFHWKYDYSFSTSSDPQDRYRQFWAAAALPLTIPMSWAQRALRVRPEGVGVLVRAVSALLAFLGASTAAYGLVRAGGLGVRDGLMIFALTSVFPPLLLNARTGFPNHLLGFLLFWTAISLTLIYCQNPRPALLYAAGCAVAFFLLIPYPPLLALPILMPGLLFWRRGVQLTIRTPSVYGAALATAVLYFVGNLLLARAAGLSLVWYRASVAAFQATRGGTVAWANARVAEFPSRVRLLIDQQILFKGHPDVVSSGRSDVIWSLGSVHVGWVLVLAMCALGATLGIRSGDRGAVTCAVILTVTAAALTIFSAPESRYLLAAAPCYSALALHALKRLRLPARTLAAVYAAIIIGTSLNTYVLLERQYAPRMDRTWPQMDGIEEFARFLGGQWEGGVRYVSFPYPRTYEADLYLRMLTNNNACWVTEEELDRHVRTADSLILPGDRFWVVGSAADDAALASWSRRGFVERAQFEARSGAGRLVILGRRSPGVALEKAKALRIRRSEPDTGRVY